MGTTLHSFTRQERNEDLTTSIYFDGAAAGEMIARDVCNAFVALSDAEAAELISGSHHDIVADNFDEFYETFQTFTWCITLPAPLYAKLSTKEKRSHFKSKIRELELPEIGFIDDIKFGLQDDARPDWRTRAQELVIKQRMPSSKASAKSTTTTTNKGNGSDRAALDSMTDIARNLAQLEIRRDAVELEKRVRVVAAECSSRGIGRSGAMVSAVDDAIIDALRKRGDELVSIVKRVVRESGDSFSSEELRKIFDDASKGVFDDADRLSRKARQTIGVPVADPQQGPALNGAKGDIIAKAYTELELFAAGVQSREKRRETAPERHVSKSEVFVTHGRDHASRDAVATFVYSLGLKPIILEHEPSRGRTIIEKFEANARVGYCIVIMSPDDEGRLREEGPELHARARQNVVFELGFMYGQLGRDRVAVMLPDASLARPTNIDGIVWIPLDAGEGWKHKLRMELVAAGLEVK